MTEAQQILNSVEQRQRDVLALRALWQSLLPLPCPTDYQLNLWLHLHRFGHVCYGVREVAKKFHKLAGNMNLDYAVRFASNVMVRSNVLRKEKQNEQYRNRPAPRSVVGDVAADFIAGTIAVQH